MRTTFRKEALPFAGLLNPALLNQEKKRSIHKLVFYQSLFCENETD